MRIVINASEYCINAYPILIDTLFALLAIKYNFCRVFFRDRISHQINPYVDINFITIKNGIGKLPHIILGIFQNNISGKIKYFFYE